MSDELKLIQIRVAEPLWRAIKAAADKNKMSIKEFVESASREHSSVVSAAKRLRLKIPKMSGRTVRTKPGGAAERVLSLLKKIGRGNIREIVDTLEPPIHIEGTTAEAVFSRWQSQQKRDVIRNAVARLIRNGTLTKDSSERISQSKID